MNKRDIEKIEKLEKVRKELRKAELDILLSADYNSELAKVNEIHDLVEKARKLVEEEILINVSIS